MGHATGMGAAVAVAVAAAGCGDNLAALPQPMGGDDPAIERGCSPSPAGAAPFSRLKRVACPEELPIGILVAGRVGDVLIENDRIQVVVRAGDEGYLMPGTAPGGIVDAALRGHADQLVELFPVVQLSMTAVDQMVLAEAGDDGPATLIVRGRAAPVPRVQAAMPGYPVGVWVETQYALEPGDDALRIRTVVVRQVGESAPATVQIGEALFTGGLVEPWLPGVGRPGDVRSGPFLASGGTSATSSYGIVYPGLESIQYLAVGGITVTAGPEVGVSSGAAVDRYLVVGDGSIGSVTDRGFGLMVGGSTAELAGTLRPAPTAAAPIDIAVADREGAPVTRIRVAADGSFRAALPPGRYQLRADSRAHTVSDAVDVTLPGDPVVLPLGDTATLAVSVADSDGLPLPARVRVRGPAGDTLDYSDAAGSLELALRPGTYSVDVSRGVEYDAFSATAVLVEAGARVELAAVLERVLDTDGWIAVDSHLHSEMSHDSRIPLADRLRAVAGEGVELAIATDHDFVTDYGPLVASLGLADWVAYRVGCETTTTLWGHVNAWPLVPDRARAAQGAIAWYGKSPGEVFDLMRAEDPGVLIQVNHPRRGGSGMLNAIDFDPETASALRDPAELGLDGADLNDFDFDALEVANGKSDPFEETFADYLALVATGHPVAATGSSDSHGFSTYAGGSRTYVYVGAGRDDPATLDLDEVDDALRARRAVISQGAFVTAALENPAAGGEPAAPGALVDLSAEPSARLGIRVQAPPWMPLARVRIYLGRVEVASFDLDPADTAPSRFDQTVELALSEDVAADGFFLVRVDPAGPGAPVLGDLDASMTNPILYDGDGDGAWSP